MQAARPPEPARDTGLPPGVRVGPLARRFLAYVVDSVVPAVAGSVIGITLRDAVGGGSAALVTVAVVVVLAWALVCWRQLAVRAATPGMRLTHLQLVGFYDGRPVGWGRVLLRWLVLLALTATGVGLLLLVASVLVSPRHQGWHDRAVRGVVIVERALAPARTGARTGTRTTRTTRTARPAGSTAVAVADAVPEDDAAPEDDASAGLPDAPVPALVAGDPGVGPELAPLAGGPVLSPDPDPGADRAAGSLDGAHRTIFDGWVAELDDGREIAVRGLVLLGRNPQPADGEDAAQLVKLSDESRTVSKTHLAIGVDDAGLFVVDRGSTNGSTITPPGRTPVTAGAFHAVSVAEGSVVSIGDHWMRIRRDA